MAKLYFRYGTMNAGKSMLLLAMASNFDERNVKYLLLKSSIDTRDGDAIHSRALGYKSCTIISPDNDSVIETSQLEGVKWILVDEAQFLSEKQVDALANIVDQYDINVMCFGLRSDFQTHLFPGSKRLFELADSIDEIKSSCSCGKKNLLNMRIGPDGLMILQGDQVEIGAEDKYVAVCRSCYKREQLKAQKERNKHI